MKLLLDKTDFGGFWLKGIKEYKGHEGEPLAQASVYHNDERVGFWSQGDHGGPDKIEFFKAAEKLGSAKKLASYAADYCKNVHGQAYSEPEGVMLAAICDHLLTVKKWRSECRKKAAFVINATFADTGEYHMFKVPWQGNEQRIEEHLDKVHGPGQYTVLNTLF